jgi:hypothetical protein
MLQAGYIEGNVRTFQVSAALEEHRLVKLSSGKLAYAGQADGAALLGSTTKETFAADEYVGVDLINRSGTRILTAAGAIAAGAVVYTAANGKVDDVATSATRVGIALTAAGADGDFLEVLVAPLSADVP